MAVLPGITAMLRPGHAGTHQLADQSGNDRLLIWGGIVHLASVQLIRPDAALVFDVAPRPRAPPARNALDWVASERLCVAGAHLPFPGFGRLARSGSGYGYSPEA
jgi:hypothetical protein